LSESVAHLSKDLAAFKSDLVPSDSYILDFWSSFAIHCGVAATAYGDVKNDLNLTSVKATAGDALSTIESMLKEVNTPSVEYLDRQLTGLEIAALLQLLESLKFCHKFLDLMAVQSKNKAHVYFQKVTLKDIERVKTAIRSKSEVTRQYIKLCKEHLVKNGRHIFWDRVFEGAIGAELKKLIGHNAVEEHIPTFRNSALDMLDGLLKIKVP
jgi:hypothetical protein